MHKYLIIPISSTGSYAEFMAYDPYNKRIPVLFQGSAYGSA